MIEKLRHVYQQHMLVRFFVQVLVVAIIYFSVRYWRSLDNIQGAAPIIHATTLSGENFDLREFSGQPVLVHFWATWCPVCEMENSNIASLAKDYPLISLASWSEGNTEVKAYLKKEKIDMPVIVDSDGEWAKLYGVKAVPTSFVIDGDGIIRFIETGYTTEVGLRLRLWWLSE